MSRSEIFILDDFNTLDLTETDSDSSTPVAGIQSVTVTPEVSIEALYTGDSTKRADKFQHEHVAQVEIGYSFFDGVVVEEWLGGAGTSAGDWADSSDPQNYEISGDFRSRDGSQSLSFTVEGLVFPSMPIFDAARGEYAQWDLQGEADDITGFSVDTPA